MTKDETLKLALEALEGADNIDVDMQAAIVKCREALAEPLPVQERCCYHDSDCAVHNMPAYPAGACDCTQQFKFWSVTGKYERQAFASLASAEAYCKGLNTAHPEGNYVVRPLREITETCTDERMCVPCYTGQGACESAAAIRARGQA